MDSKIEIMTLGMLKKQLSKFEVSDDTKIFLDTGWDSIQEIAPDALEVAEAREFTVEDELTKESFSGYAREEKAERFDTSEQSETVIVIKNLY
ncbi:hypothetical protein [Enterococcus faecium]|uniref:hypothetical protein n=1 Tax=Enterococcus faecium TaxID=1352 RepID=UPI000F6743A8|nr:hypothetical protein [Enterococcus faecium]RSA51470.1 hypothetical protein EGK30_00545 [Enterococcus faecium]RSB03243.1 hypothetical protein EGK49_00545 [Enterococcus faecium]RSB08330.1 hypothetical protein EGK73_00545 [Enterococcus faecium]